MGAPHPRTSCQAQHSSQDLVTNLPIPAEKQDTNFHLMIVRKSCPLCSFEKRSRSHTLPHLQRYRRGTKAAPAKEKYKRVCCGGPDPSRTESLNPTASSTSSFCIGVAYLGAGLSPGDCHHNHLATSLLCLGVISKTIMQQIEQKAIDHT